MTRADGDAGFKPEEEKATFLVCDVACTLRSIRHLAERGHLLLGDIDVRELPFDLRAAIETLYGTQDGIVALAVRAMDALDALDAAIMCEKRAREADHAEP